MMLRVDYHFHPNLPQNDEKAFAKCKKIWEMFKEKKINCIIVTEHAYKNPQRAFELMLKTKPKGIFCFPGMEYATKEGIDIVIFSSTDAIYRFSELKPFKMAYFELIKFVMQRKDLFSFVTHPYTLGLTSVINKLNHEAYRKSTNLLNAVEISNGSFDNLYLFLKKIPFGLKQKIEHINMNKKLPEADYPKKIKFLAAGSDAHHPEEIGNCYVLDCPGKASREKAFEKITNNHGRGKIFINDRKLNTLLLFKSAFTSFNEFLIKLFLRH